MNSLLRSVSRSFYLSLRLLPAPVRPAISLAYLLARASDSIADVASAPAEDRIRLLKDLPGTWPSNAVSQLGPLALADSHLLSALPELLKRLRTSPDRKEIEKVWQTIREGQTFDLERFPSPLPLPLEEAQRYTGLVAGCVGEFWTDVCFKNIPDYSRESPDTMRRFGFSFGCGLQWINILRDRHSDAEAGRNYFDPEHFSAVLDVTHAHLADGRRYTEAVRPRRIRAACRLPLDLAAGTLKKMETNPAARNIKVSRGFVWRSLAMALLR